MLLSKTKPQSILLTNIWTCEFAGSELNCLNLATALNKMGYSVEVATFDFASPLAEEFAAANIPVFNVLEQDLPSSHYDIIWSHHSIVLDHLIFTKKITSDYLIFSCLSSLLPLEAPPLYANEASLCLANSGGAKDVMLTEGILEENILVFPNYVDSTWLDSYKQREYNTTPKKVAVISNHVPSELLEAKKLLEDKNCTVDLYGIAHTYVKITPEVLDNYDLVITIGKTVQFAMSLQIPVYCYDHFGGPGFLTPENFKTAAHYTFSGRGFTKKDAQVIADEILSDYAAHLKYLPIHRQFILETSILENNIKNVLDIIKTKPVSYDDIYAKYGHTLRHHRISTDLFLYRKEAIEINHNMNDLIQDLNNRLEDYNSQLNAIYNSRTWKLRNFLLRFIRR